MKDQTKKRKVSHKGARKKGHNFERVIAQSFVESGWPNAKRHLEYQASEANGCDLDNTHPFIVQCKKRAKYVNPSTIEEIKILHPSEIPVVITAGDHKPPMAILSFEHFMLMAKICREYKETKKELEYRIDMLTYKED